jgi:hypothetical protein
MTTNTQSWFKAIVIALPLISCENGYLLANCLHATTL